MGDAMTTALDVLLRTQGMTQRQAVRWLDEAGKDVAAKLVEAYGDVGAGKLAEINEIVRMATEIDE